MKRRSDEATKRERERERQLTRVCGRCGVWNVVSPRPEGSVLRARVRPSERRVHAIVLAPCGTSLWMRAIGRFPVAPRTDPSGLGETGSREKHSPVATARLHSRLIEQHRRDFLHFPERRTPNPGRRFAPSTHPGRCDRPHSAAFFGLDDQRRKIARRTRQAAACAHFLLPARPRFTPAKSAFFALLSTYNDPEVARNPQQIVARPAR
jgi:hypothetical protein